MKLIKAIFFSSLVIIPAYLVVIMLSGEITEPLVWLWVLIAYLIGLCVIVFIGVPTHLLFKALKLKSFYPYSVVAFSIPSLYTWLSRPFGDDGF